MTFVKFGTADEMQRRQAILPQVIKILVKNININTKETDTICSELIIFAKTNQSYMTVNC